MIKVKVPSVGPICHHRHLIQDTFERFLMTLQSPAVSPELPVILLKVKPKSQNIYCQAG